jgi:hypothetical protein
MAGKLVFALAALAVLAAQDPSATAPQEPPLAYPTFEPFLSSKVQALIFGDVDKVDLDELSKKLAQLDEVQRVSKDAAEKVAPKPTEGPSAALLPKLDGKQDAIYSLLPIVMIKLRALWDAPSWTDEQCASASKAAEIVARLPDAPALAFEKSKDEKNHAELERLVRWFYAQTAKPHLYAAMIFTLDDGPFAGLPFDAPAALPSERVQKLDEHLELRLSKVERAKEPWVLQCLRDGKPLWARVISAAPDQSVGEVGFTSAPPTRHGRYGWTVHLHADWTYGDEHAPVYLDAQGNFLFYFLSW